MPIVYRPARGLPVRGSLSEGGLSQGNRSERNAHAVPSSARSTLMSSWTLMPIAA
jgi:hypothetical protein